MPIVSGKYTGDMNDLTSIGFQRLEGASNVSNAPTGLSEGCWALTLVHTIGYYAQIVIWRDGSKIYVRGCAAGTWSAWKLITMT